MVILDLDVCPNLDLEVPRMFWLYFLKVNNLKIWRVYRFDRELTLMISDLDYYFET